MKWGFSGNLKLYDFVVVGFVVFFCINLLKINKKYDVKYFLFLKIFGVGCFIMKVL